MKLKVKKRNGNVVRFDSEKIEVAIQKAYTEVKGHEMSKMVIGDIISQIVSKCSEYDYRKRPIEIEEIQDIVENALIRNGYWDVAKAYIRYRYKREIVRNSNNDFFNAIGEKLNGSNIENQNANVDEQSFGGRRGEATNVMMKQYALDNIVSPMSKNNHLNNEIYIHDLDSYAIGMHNCLSIPFDDLLSNGFNTRQTDIRPANSINTAFQLLAVIFQLQSLQQFGGVSATHLDWTMVPYVRKSFYKHYVDGMQFRSFSYVVPESHRLNNFVEVCNSEMSIDDEYYKEFIPAYDYALAMTKRELQQAVEGMYHNLNTLQSRSGNQLPFTSINYGTCTLTEGRMVIQALLEGSLNGVGKLHKTPVFPCGIFQCMKGVNREPGDPNYDLYRLALKSTAKRLYPNYANVDWSGNAGYDKNDPRTYFSTMGKRKLSPCKIF